ncbi:hypothetical protein TRIP_C21563 [Candidatus Zixiibacteriota bacterium]|nr:hypothetical protein TRIP_C21563 [candidate division Zixibacteria bacterium]
MKRIIIPAIFLLVIIAVWLTHSRMESKSIAPKESANFLKIDPAQINHIVINSVDDTLDFRLIDGKWILEGNPPRLTDSNAVETMIAAAGEMKVGNIISENPERQKDFLVDSATGNLIQFYNNDQLLASIFIGKMSPDFAHTYVRKPDSKEVYLADGLITYIFNRKHNQWLNRTIVALNPDSVEAVEFDYGDRAYHIDKSSSQWYAAKKPYRDSLQADSLKVKNFLMQICHLKATDFISIADSGLVHFDPPDLTIHINMNNGQSQTIEFAPIGDKSPRAYCRIPGFADTYVIPPALYDNFRREFSSFLP